MLRYLQDIELGARVEDVFLYIMERCLLVMTICIDPRKRNRVDQFDNGIKNIIISSIHILYYLIIFFLHRHLDIPC